MISRGRYNAANQCKSGESLHHLQGDARDQLFQIGYLKGYRRNFKVNMCLPKRKDNRMNHDANEELGKLNLQGE